MKKSLPSTSIIILTICFLLGTAITPLVGSLPQQQIVSASTNDLPQGVAILEWTGPYGTFSDYMREKESTPFSSQTLGVAGRDLDTPMIVILVNAALQPSIDTELTLYNETLVSLGYNTAVVAVSGGTAADLKNQIRSYWETGYNVTGSVLIGDLPVAWYHHYLDFNKTGGSLADPDEFPCDLFLMDLDGDWRYNASLGMYDQHTNGLGDTAPEIYIGRIDASSIPGPYIGSTNKYLQKVYDFWIGETVHTDYGLTYTEDDWAIYDDMKHDIHFAYDDYEAIWFPNVDRNDYVYNRLPAAYEFIQLACHSWSGGHAFTYGGWASSSDVRFAPPQALFYNLFCCGASRFTDYDCVSNAYVIDTDTPSLAVVGSTKSGSMLNFRDFYEPLGDGHSFGKAFQLWFEKQAPYSEDPSGYSEVSWYYGMTILGDPTTLPTLDTKPPLWQNQGQNKSSILRGDPVALFAQVKDNGPLHSATLATNETGTWQNITGAYGSPIDLTGVMGEWMWTNFTWQNFAIPQNTQVSWRIYYNDTRGNANVTDIMSFTISNKPLITDNTGTIGYTDSAFTFNSSLFDDHGIDSAWVEYWYGDGDHSNESMNMVVGGTYEHTITIPYNSIEPLHYILAVNDTMNSWSHTVEKTVTIYDNLNPNWRQQRQNRTYIQPGESITLGAQGKDNILLDHAYLSTNETGDWVNYSGGEWWDINWKFSKKITINHTQVEDNLTNYPVLIVHTELNFTTHAQPDGDDFVFVDASNTTRYNHEIDFYDNSTGELIAWVNITNLSATEDTILYLYYGNSTRGNQENIKGTWGSNYIMVHHLDGASYTELVDSSPNDWNITSVGGSPQYSQDGQVGQCVYLNGINDEYLQAGDFELPLNSSYTSAAWVYVNGGVGERRYLFEGATTSAISLLVWRNETFRNIAQTEGDWPSCYSTTTVDVGSPEWYYVCTRADADTGRLALFVNGVSEQDTALVGGRIVAEYDGLNIGTRKGADRYHLYGKIDELRISDVARTDAWIHTEYNNMVAPLIFATIGEELKRPLDVYDSPMSLVVSDEWAWSNFTWLNSSLPEGTEVGWQITYMDLSQNLVTTEIKSFNIGTPTGVLLEGSCYDIGMQPVNNAIVEVINLDTGDHWQANMDNHAYSLLLNRFTDIKTGDPLRIIATTPGHLVNITEHMVTEQDMETGLITVDLILDIHYRDLTEFPMYHAEFIPGEGFQCGAAVGQMILNYIHWNKTESPGGPPMTYADQGWLYMNFSEHDVPSEWIEIGLDFWEDDQFITAYELWMGLQWNKPQPYDTYGYNFWAHINESSSQLMKLICVMIDYPIPTTEGHTEHCPAAFPAFGDYSNWMAIRGIHTDMNTWNPPDFPDFNIKGFWVNDPLPDGIGENTYKTVDEFLTTYFKPMDLPGDPFENNSYVVLVEPPEDFDTSVLDTTSVTIDPQHPSYSPFQRVVIQRMQRKGLRAHIIDKITFNAAKDRVQSIFTLQGKTLEGFQPRQITYVNNRIGSDYRLIIFDNYKTEETLVVSLDAYTGALKEFSIGKLTLDYLKGVTYAYYDGGCSAFHPST